MSRSMIDLLESLSVSFVHPSILPFQRCQRLPVKRLFLGKLVLMAELREPLETWSGFKMATISLSRTTSAVCGAGFGFGLCACTATHTNTTVTTTKITPSEDAAQR